MVVFFAVTLVAAAAQAIPEQPDFSGRWVLDTSTAAASSAAQVLVVEQPISRANVRGEPMKPAYLRISIRRETPSGNTDETRLIGTLGGTVGGITNERPSPEWRTYEETLWQGGALVFTSGSSGADGRRTGNWTERRETWSLDSEGRLRVEKSVETWNSPRRVDVYLYRRETPPPRRHRRASDSSPFRS